jgi:kynurenine formamidase
VVIYTALSRLYGQQAYFTDYPLVSRELAQLFVERHVKMVCMDSPSPDRHPYEIHKLLLENNILIAENLTHIEKLLPVRRFEIIALPLNILADSSPARVVARTFE